MRLAHRSLYQRVRSFLHDHGKWMFPVFLLFLLWVWVTQPEWRSPFVQLTQQPTMRVLAVHEEFEPQESHAIFNNKVIPVPQLAQTSPLVAPILGETTAQKHIEVDLSAQRLLAYEDNKLVYSFAVSTGKWGKTPTGKFTIWGKFRYTKMSGGSKERHTYYYLPNVPYVMFFANEDVPRSAGFSIHGTYWHNNFGHPMSHGCVNMKTEEVALLYQWAQPTLKEKKSILADKENPGTEVLIYGVAPKE